MTHFFRNVFSTAILSLSFFLVLDGGVLSASAQGIDTIAKQAIIVDFNTGVTIYQKNGDEPMPPSSMSKLMTTYSIFKRLREGTLTMETVFSVSENAKKMSLDGSRMFLETGQSVRLEDLLRGIIIQSGNDACIVVAEGVSTSEAAFAADLNRLGREIGLTNSTFRNATGLPDPGHMMTPRDLSILAKRMIVDFPEYYHFYSERSFTYNKITQRNRNPLLGKTIGTDGMKTGHTQVAGYGLVASVVRNGHRIIMVLNGLASEKQRAEEAARLVEVVYRDYGLFPLFKAGEQVEVAEVWLGKEKTVPLVTAGDIEVTIPFAARPNMQVKVIYNGPIAAPILKGAPIAKMVVTVPGQEPIERDLVAGVDVPRIGIAGKVWASMLYMVFGQNS